ncbi:MAG: DNA gyrase subunit A [Chloroflexi bacterium]|nr:DNA gyrase subunit A [Chloroflexota bacterium]
MVTSIGQIKPVKIEEEMRSSYLDYAMSVIVARALPDVRDGLKPVQRRILYAMMELGMRSNAPYRKSARIVGEVLGKFHPHGDVPVYDAMVRMAQPFSMRMPLIDGQGNFGSVDDDPPAAMRYTEARLSSIAEELLANIEQETVDFTDNFDGSLKEPLVLPARLPNLLVNGASGIAVGMATSIPPHNLSEICDAVVLLIDNSETTPDELMQIVKGPDFPTGAIIWGIEGTRSAYTTGHGRAVVRARAEIQSMGRSGRQQIIVTELPYQVNKAALVEKIAQLAKDKRIEGISEVRDESDREGLRVVVELRRDAQAEMVLNNLYKHTAMQASFNMNMLALIGGVPLIITLKQALVHYINFRRQVVFRRSEYELKKARERAHILEGLRIALNNLNTIIALIRGSKDVEEARTGLMQQFGLSQLQAQAILDMQLRRIAALEREKIEQEYQELRKTIEELEGILADPQKVLAVVRDETQKLKDDFGDPRRTEIVEEEPGAFRREELEPHQEVVITLSQRGYVKRIPSSTYRSQHRGGKGVLGMVTRDNDPVKHLVVADTHDVILFFTDRGRVQAMRCFEIPSDASRSTRGAPVINLIPALGEREQVNTVVAVPSLQEDTFLLLATRLGKIKRLPLKAISAIRSAGLIVMGLGPRDELVSVGLAGEEEEIIMVTASGESIRFSVSSVPIQTRTAGGVKGMRLKGGDLVVFFGVVNPQGQLLVVSQQGFGKLTPLSRYRSQHRGGGGVSTFRVNAKTGPVAGGFVVANGGEVFLVSAQAQVFRTELSEIPVKGRDTQGVIIWRPESGDVVASVACVDGALRRFSAPPPTS